MDVWLSVLSPQFPPDRVHRDTTRQDAPFTINYPALGRYAVGGRDVRRDDEFAKNELEAIYLVLLDKVLGVFGGWELTTEGPDARIESDGPY